MSAHLVYSDGSPYPTFAPRPRPLRSWGVCELSNPRDPHEGELHEGICENDWARLMPFDIRERRHWRRDLRLWWVHYGWLVLGGLAAIGYLAALLLVGDWWRHVQEVMAW